VQCLNATQLLASTDDVDALLVALVTSTLAAPSHCADLDGVSDWWGALHEVLEEETHLNASDTTALACECRREADRVESTDRPENRECDVTWHYVPVCAVWEP